jgi:hypothetical protein
VVGSSPSGHISWIGVALVLLCGSAPAAAACNGNAGQPGAFETNEALPSFTFDMDVAIAMRHFPWLHFHMGGDGTYEPGKAYVVHFGKLPWFAPRQQHDVDLAMLDPAMWPSRFLYQEAGQENGNVLFDLRAIDDKSLTSAIVGLDPMLCARKIQAVYNDGTQIEMDVKFAKVDGFMLPATLTADVNEPFAPFSASAVFKDYSFGFATTAPPSRSMQRPPRTRSRS